MSKPPHASSSILAVDARPIPLSDLIATQREAIRRILDIANAIRDENREPPACQAPAPPWNTVDENRTHRVIMIDGGRGTGKTSLLLTLVQNWHPDHKVNDVSNPAPHLFTKDDVAVRVLPTFDFDPNPASLHPFAALVLSFEPIAEFLDQKRNHHQDGVTHRERWGEVYKGALMGWTAGAAEKQLHVDLDTFVIDQQDGHLAWHRLQDRWRRFVDQLIIGLEDARQLPDDGLLLLPIDDLDLQPAMGGDLLLAIRLLRHDRLVFLLNGDLDHLREVIETELYKKGSMGASLPECARDERFARASELGRALIDKVVPLAHRVQPQRLSLPELATMILGDESRVDPAAIQEWSTASNEDLFNLSPSHDKPQPDGWRLPSPAQLVAGGGPGGGVKGAPHGLYGASLHSLLSDRVRQRAPTYSFRDASVLRTCFRPQEPSARREWLADELLRRARDNRGRALFSSDLRLIETERAPMILSPWVSNVEHWVTIQESYGAAIKAPSSVRLHKLGNDELVNGDATETLLTIWSLAHSIPHPDVVHQGTMWSPLLLTVWKKEKFGIATSFRWPGLMPWLALSKLPSPWNLLDSSSGHDKKRSLLSRWVSVNANLANRPFRPGKSVCESMKMLFDHDEERQGSRFQSLMSAPYDSSFSEWIWQYLPVLAAPEFGLDVDDANDLLECMHTAYSERSPRGWSSVDELQSCWQRARRESLFLTINLHTQQIDASDRAVADYDARTGRLSQAEERIREAFPDHPWFRHFEVQASPCQPPIRGLGDPVAGRAEREPVPASETPMLDMKGVDSADMAPTEGTDDVEETNAE